MTRTQKLADRRKTDIRASDELMDTVDILCARLGQSKNSFFVMAAALASARLLPVLVPGGGSTEEMKRLLRKEFDAAMQER